MGRHSSYLKQKLRKGLWSPEEDEKLFNHITLYGVGCWSSVPKLAGLQRCGKSCRLRWINYLRPDLKRGMFSQQEEDLILRLHQVLGNRWAQIATQLPGRTDNEIKNFWNSYLKKKLMKQGIDPGTHKPFTRDQIEVKSENSNSPTTDTKPSLPPPSVFRPSEPAFLLGDPTMDFSLQHGIGPNKAFFNLSPVLEFHRFGTSHPVNCSTSLLAGHRQCQDTRTRPTNVAGHCGMIGEESASSDRLASKMSSLFFDEAITIDDPRTKNIAGYQMNGDLEDNSGAFSWGSDYINKLDPSSNQFQLSGVIKSNEAMKPSQWSHQEEEPIVTSYNALDFGDYPLTSISEDFDVLPDL